MKSNKTNTILKRFIASPWTLPVLVFAGFFLLNLGISGPAYMSDEVGYLDKAVTIAGSPVHLSSSWFAGYSFMVSPAFMVSGNPRIEWYLVLLLNALMWAGSAALLRYVLRRTHPQASDKAVFLATLGAMLYPSWLSMSGYAFATSGFVLVFLAALAAVLKSGFTHMRWLALAGILAGYLCWIHPLGFLFLGLFGILLAAQGFIKKQPGLYLIPLGSLLMGLAYLFAVQPLLDHAMSGSLANDSHYTAGLSAMLRAIPTWHYWLQVAGLLVGFVFFAAVASFGLVVYGASPIVKELFSSKDAWKRTVQDSSAAVRLMSLVLVIGVIVLTALSWGAAGQLRMDQWVYGRYSDMYVLPVLGFGLLARWRWKQAAGIAAFAASAGLLLSKITNPTNTSFGFDNKVNIQALWPMHLASVVHANQYYVWGIIGACGIAFCGLLGTGRRKVFLPLLLVPIMLAGASNYLYNRTITEQHATVSSLYDYIKSNYSTTDCIGFTPAPDNYERFNLYSYYLHGYNIRKMTMEQWQQQGCTGPYLTYTPLAMASDLRIVGVEAGTGLQMVARSDQSLAVRANTGVPPILREGKVLGDTVIFN